MDKNLGAKYFMQLISLGHPFPYINTDIRKIIWQYALEPLYMICTVQEDIIVKLYIHIWINL